MIKASRAFVCVRPLTYESKEEAEFLISLFKGREGTLENTVFGLLDSDGKTALSRIARTPKMIYGGSGKEEIAKLAEAMKKAAGKGKEEPRELPLVVDLRRALNVAACDGLPLAVLSGDDDQKLADLVWSDAFVGRFTVVKVSKEEKLDAIKGADAGAALLVVAPGAYGLDGTVLSQARDAAGFRDALESALKKFEPIEKDPGRHIQEGRRAGVEWKTEIPDSDPGPVKGPKRP